MLLVFSEKPLGEKLTLAESRVAALAARGASYKEVARETGSSPATVRNQLHSIYLKLKVSGRTELSNVLMRMNP